MDNKIKRLLPVLMSYSSTDNIWTFSPQEDEYPELHFKADEDKIKRLLRRMRAKDSVTYPNSRKGITYRGMLDDIQQKGSSSIYVWRSNCPKTLDLLKAMMEQ